MGQPDPMQLPAVSRCSSRRAGGASRRSAHQNSGRSKVLKSIVAVALLGAVLTSGQPAPAAEGDAAAGERVFVRCQVCHVLDQEQNRIGPHLVGVFGREAGAVEGYNYSPAMQEADVVWDVETLDAYLTDPRAYIPGNKMAFAGLRNEEERANLIAYLEKATAAQ
jgi:cytochrome c